MTIARIDKADWTVFFAHATHLLVGKHTEIEIADPALGNQKEVNWLPLLGMTYDSKSDIIEIVLEGLDHTISKPFLVYVDETLGSMMSFQIIDEGGTQQIVLMRDPLMLPYIPLR